MFATLYACSKTEKPCLLPRRPGFPEWDQKAVDLTQKRHVSYIKQRMQPLQQVLRRHSYFTNREIQHTTHLSARSMIKQGLSCSNAKRAYSMPPCSRATASLDYAGNAKLTKRSGAPHESRLYVLYFLSSTSTSLLNSTHTIFQDSMATPASSRESVTEFLLSHVNVYPSGGYGLRRSDPIDCFMPDHRPYNRAPNAQTISGISNRSITTIWRLPNYQAAQEVFF